MIDFQQLARELGPDPTDVPVDSPVAVANPEPDDFGWVDDHMPKAIELPPIIDSVEFVAQKYEPSPELIKGLVHQGTKIVIGGGSKSFKTWVQLDAALSVAYGINWMEHETVAGRVLFVNLEIKPEFFQSRVTKLCESRGIQQCSGRLDIWNLRGYSAPYRIIIPKIVERIKSSGYSLVVLDPIYKLYGNTDENSASEVAQLLNELEKVCVETGAAILFGAHYSKGNQAAKESIDRISGSGVFARDPDTIIPFTKHEEEGSFVVEPILRNLPQIDPFVVTWNYPLMERDSSLDPAKLKQSSGKPKTHVAADLYDLLPDSGLSNKNWQEKAEKSCGISNRTFYRLKSELEKATAIMYSRVDDCWKPLRKR